MLSELVSYYTKMGPSGFQKTLSISDRLSTFKHVMLSQLYISRVRFSKAYFKGAHAVMYTYKQIRALEKNFYFYRSLRVESS